MRVPPLLAILLLTACPAMAADYDGLPEAFFGFIEQGETEKAIDLFADSHPWVGKNTDQINNLKTELTKLDTLLGEYRYRELIVEQSIGTRYAHLIYTVGYERQPVRFELRFYRPGNEWRLQGVSFDTSLVQDIDKLTNQKIAP